MSTDRLALILDDDPIFADSTATYFKSIGWAAVVAGTPKAADEAIEKSSPALVIVDVDLGNGSDGIDWARARKQGGLRAKIIVVSASRKVGDIHRATGVADAYLLKPLSFGELCRRLISLGVMTATGLDAPGVGTLEIPARVRIADSILIVQCSVRWTEGQTPDQITINQGKSMGFELKKMRGLGSSSQADGTSLSMFQPSGWSMKPRGDGEPSKESEEGPFSTSAMIFQPVRNITIDGTSISFSSSVPLPPGENFTIKWKEKTIVAHIEVLERSSKSELNYQISATIVRS